MSNDTSIPVISEEDWVPQGFYGNKQTVIEAKIILDNDLRAGAWLPPQGSPPIDIDTNGTESMFAVWTRRNNPIEPPAGLKEAIQTFVTRMVGG
jgi:hypothetical protein